MRLSISSFIHPCEAITITITITVTESNSNIKFYLGEDNVSLFKEVAANPITNTVQGKDMDALPTQNVQRIASPIKQGI